jgi:hypothetical protein
MAVGALLLGTLAVSVEAPPADAAPAGSSFSPGNIISDATFYNSTAMSLATVDSFLRTQRPDCAAGYTCLPSYSENVLGRAADQYCPGALPGGWQTAAQIIVNVSLACGVNPQALIVLLQKEQGLVTSRSPSSTAYQRATGYGCPDTAPCNAEYFGFSNQLWRAARQFEVYRQRPASFNHRAGQVNAVRLHPNAACGATNVYIENQATAGLYNYTPYQPNGAALANLYGTGDACSSYGNRNFWRLFWDWFGNPQGGNYLVRTAADPTIYLITDTTKHPVRSASVFSALSTLGPWGYASQAFIDSLTTGKDATNLLRDPENGFIYLAAYGQKNKFEDCAMVARWGLGAACGSYIDVTDPQLNRFATGSAMTALAQSATNSQLYWVENGTTHAAHTWAQVVAAAAGGSTAYTRLPQSTIDLLPKGADLLDQPTVAKFADSPTLYLLNGLEKLIPIADGALLAAYGLPAHTVLTAGSRSAMTVGTTPLGLAVRCSGSEYVAGSGKLWKVASSSGLPAVDLDASTCAALTTSATSISGALFLRNPANGYIYQVTGGTKRLMATMAEVNAANGANPLVLVPSTAGLLASIPDARTLTTGKLVKSASSPTVFLIDGPRKVPITSFDVPAQLGFTGYSVVAADMLSAYTTAGQALSVAVTCGADSFIAGAGERYRATSTSGLAATALDPATCALVPVSAAAPVASVFLRVPSNGYIYSVVDGRKTFMATWAEVLAANGGAAPTLIPSTATIVASIPNR